MDELIERVAKAIEETKSDGDFPLSDYISPAEARRAARAVLEAAGVEALQARVASKERIIAALERSHAASAAFDYADGPASDCDDADRELEAAYEADAALSTSSASIETGDGG